MKKSLLPLISAIAQISVVAAFAGPQDTLRIKDHRFIPDTLIAQANERFKLVVINQDSSAEEFESFPLDREKVVAPHGEIIVFLGPLAQGTYGFIGEFHGLKGALVIQGGH